MTDIKAKHQFMNIEFLRIIAILAIIMLHLFHSGMGLHNLGLDVHLYDKLFKMTSNGQKGVDFFFILSGLFLYMSMIKLPEQPLFPFVCKKIIRLWPVMVFATLLAFVLSLFGLLKFTYWDNIYALLFLNGTPLAINQGNISITWYCSALMVHFILFFYLFQNVPRKYFWLIVCILIYVSYGVILQAKNFNINDQKQTFGYIFHVGMMRASGGDRYRVVTWLLVYML